MLLSSGAANADWGDVYYCEMTYFGDLKAGGKMSTYDLRKFKFKLDQAKNAMVIVSEDGMTFEQVDQWKPPTPDLRKKLQFTMNDVGDFTLKGQLGLFDMSGKDYDTTIFGNIHQQVGLAIWEEGDPILVRITKQ